MTQTEKVRAYDEALERARKLKENPQNVFNEYSPKEGDTICDYIFPELKESEDEKIKHEIKVVLANTDLSQFTLEYTFADMLAWLEKQGNQEISDDKDILQRFSFYSYKDEPNILYLSELYVNLEHRNKGIGTKIIQVADKVAANIGCNYIRLKTKIGSNAERLYRRNGYNTLIKEGNQIWLEKQGKQKPAIEMKSAEESLGIDSETYNEIVDECIYGKQKLEEKPDTAFHEDDWIVQENIGVYKVIEVCESWYEVIDNQNNHYSIGFDKEYMCHLWTIKDAMDGDVLVADNRPFIYNGSKNEVTVGAYCGFNVKNKFSFAYNYVINRNITPATKEQRDILFEEMQKKGYEWDAEKKELKKFNFSKLIKYNSNPPSIDKKSEWSEEDERTIKEIDEIIYECPYCESKEEISNWLNSLKQRIIG